MYKMKSFKYYINEDKTRFIKNNPNLTAAQKDELIHFFKKNRQAEKEIDWNKYKTLTYDDFLDVMMKSKSGRKIKLKCNKIKVNGYKNGEDYVRVVMPAKDYCAFIPLKYEVAQYMNTRKFGPCSGDWCIGSTQTVIHWNDEVIEQQQVPIYVFNNESKWVVMIHENNKTYDVWSIENRPTKVHEGIPNFSIRKNLLRPNQKKMYDEIREEYYSEEEYMEVDITEAEKAYEKLVTDIENAANQYERAYQEFYDTNERIKRDTIEEYESEAEELQEEEKKIMDILNEMEVNDEFSVIYDGMSYTKDELEEKLEELQVDISSLYDKAYEIENMDVYEMYDAEGIVWTDEPMHEEDIYNDVEYVDINHPKYSDYTDLMEEYGFDFNRDKVNEDIYYYIIGEYTGAASSMLEKHTLYHPEVINQM